MAFPQNLADLMARVVSGANAFRDREAKLAQVIVDGLAPGGSRIVASGVHTTVGGSATEDIAVPGVQVGDTVVVTLNVEGSTPRTIDTAIAAADEVSVVFSGDPSTDHVVSYIVMRG